MGHTHQGSRNSPTHGITFFGISLTFSSSFIGVWGEAWKRNKREKILLLIPSNLRNLDQPDLSKSQHIKCNTLYLLLKERRINWSRKQIINLLLRVHLVITTIYEALSGVLGMLTQFVLCAQEFFIVGIKSAQTFTSISSERQSVWGKQMIVEPQTWWIKDTLQKPCD